MITKNPMQLKAIIKKKATESRISPQLVMQNYMLERLFVRVSLSKYSRNFILKGGLLIAAIIGLDSRATMDMDTTVKGLPLTHESIQKIFNEICSISADDNITFGISHITDIREGDEYNGLRVHLTANYSPIAVEMKVDVTTGDKITPKEIEYEYKMLFDSGSIAIMAYNLETILAEKFETVLSRSIANTRPRDFYDIYVLYKLQLDNCDTSILHKALIETAKKRGSISVIWDYKEIISKIKNDSQMQNFWNVYQEEFNYAKDISFNTACDTILQLMEILESHN